MGFFLVGDEDLITLLKGLIEFKSSQYEKRRPYVDMYSFYYFIAEKLQVKVDRFRMNDKVRRLKRKLFANLEKKGQDPEVEKAIVVEEVAANGKIDEEYPHLAATFNVMKKNMSLIGSDKMRDLEEKLNKLEEEETDLKIKRLDFIRENCKLVAEHPTQTPLPRVGCSILRSQP
ncbi:STOREKEEPER protein-like [Nicotiana tabacum]|uniref:STOREKEEPER protein-like n=1 Tax=Nicotiana tabacum TaxID=4097 RepID=A0AC58SIL0_TOBAC